MNSGLKALVLLAGVTMAYPAAAQHFPDRQILIVVNSAAGGPVDIIARAIKEDMQETLGKPIVIENRATGGGLVGAASVKRADPDGYTILLSSAGAMVTAPLVNSAAQYQPVTDFAPVTLLAEVPAVFAINPSIPAKTLPEMIDLAKAAPGKYSYASNGIGTPGHLAGEVLKLRAGIDMLHVPYSASTQAATAVLTGEVSMYPSSPALILPHVEVGKLRIIAHSGAARMDQMPGVQTVFEIGYPDLAIPSWYGLFAPLNTPKPVIDTLHKAASKALNKPEVKAVLEKAIYRIIAGGPDELHKLHEQQYARWKTLLKEVGMQVY